MKIKKVQIDNLKVGEKFFSDNNCYMKSDETDFDIQKRFKCIDLNTGKLELFKTGTNVSIRVHEKSKEMPDDLSTLIKDNCVELTS